MTKEEIYDAQINPLMAQIIEICNKHKIACLATFGLGNEDDPSLCCTTALLDESYAPPTEMLKALNIIYK